MAQVTMADVAKFKSFLNAVLRTDPTGEFDTWECDLLNEKIGSRGNEDDEELAELPDRWVRHGETSFSRYSKSLDELIRKVSRTHKVREMDTGRWYVVAR